TAAPRGRVAGPPRARHRGAGVAGRPRGGGGRPLRGSAPKSRPRLILAARDHTFPPFPEPTAEMFPMRRLVLLLAAGTAVSAGCGGDVVVQAQLEGADGAEPTLLADLPVRLLPYDRDALFDSLEAAYPEPEPAVPDSVLQLREQMLAAQAEWQENEARW